MTASSTTPAPFNPVDAEEVARFAALAHEWWDEHGAYAPLHGMTPIRVRFIRDCIAEHFSSARAHATPLDGLQILDIGCGGGLLAEPLCRLGATVTGIDPADASIAVARLHAEQAGLAITYEAITAEAMLESGQRFDVVIASEVLEHVPEPHAMWQTMAALVKPNGLVLVSTINRTLKAYALAIVGAEYILRWLPIGTHDWNKFITPHEMTGFAEQAGLNVCDKQGMIYNPLTRSWSLSHTDLAVNYWLGACKS